MPNARAAAAGHDAAADSAIIGGVSDGSRAEPAVPVGISTSRASPP